MIKTRIAPSPTGNLHIGTARSALFNYLFAKQKQGEFILRLEDTDRARSKKEFETDIIEGLTWLGLSWDELYHQSERFSTYRHYLEQLLKEKKAFYCSHTIQETEGTVHICSKRDNQTIPLPGSVIRFKTPLDEEVRFNDIVRGKVIFHTREIGDFAIAKTLDEPLFNFANVIDDEEMNITHVIRGEDHISNTPKHILLRTALRFRELIYAHLPLALGPDKSKLSKRHGAAALTEFRRQGYLSEAMVNMMAFLGWNPGDAREFFTLEELVKEFSLERVKKGGAVFDIARLNFLNQHYLKTLPLEDVAARAQPFLERAVGAPALSKVDLAALTDLERSRVATLQELANAVEFIFTLGRYDPSLLLWKDQAPPQAKENLARSLALIEKISPSEYTKDTISLALLAQAQALGDKGSVLWPLRVALSGKKNSPGPFDIAFVLGKQETSNRIRYAMQLLNE